TAEGDRERRKARAHRGSLVAVFPDGEECEGAISGEPLAYLARPRRHVGSQRPLMAGRRDIVGPVPERSGQGEERSTRHLLLFYRRAAARLHRAAASWDGRDP